MKCSQKLFQEKSTGFLVPAKPSVLKDFITRVKTWPQGGQYRGFLQSIASIKRPDINYGRAYK